MSFNEQAHWVVRTQPLGGVDDLQGQIAGIQPLGQTNIFAGLEQAVESLEDATATRRHIILLTDGWSSSGQYDEILERMKAAGITLSTVGAGGGSNPFLQGLAQQGGGRFYDAANPASIPDIFLKETQQVSGQQIIEEPFFPILTSSSPILRGLDDGLPRLRGYNGTTAKPAAQTVLVTAPRRPAPRPVAVRPRPVGGVDVGLDRALGARLARLGRVLAVLQPARVVDVPGRGDRRHRGRVRHARRPDDAPRRERRGGWLAARLLLDDGGRRRARLHDSSEVDLVQVAPGVYEVPLGEIDSGAYGVRVTQTRPGSTPLGRTVGLVAPTAAEYRLLGTNEPFLTALRTRDRRKRDRDPARPVDPRPADDVALDRPVAAAAGPRAACSGRSTSPCGASRSGGASSRRPGAGSAALPRRRRATAARTATGESLLATRARATSAETRAALRRHARRGGRAARRHGDDPGAQTGEAAPPVAPPSSATAAPAPVDAAPPSTAPPPATPAAPATGPAAPASDTLARLRDAKRRARER